MDSKRKLFQVDGINPTIGWYQRARTQRNKTFMKKKAHRQQNEIIPLEERVFKPTWWHQDAGPKALKELWAVKPMRTGKFQKVTEALETTQIVAIGIIRDSKSYRLQGAIVPWLKDNGIDLE